LPPASLTQVVNFAAGVTAIGKNLGKDVAARVVDTGGKLAADFQRRRWSTCLRFSKTSVVNLPPIVNDIGGQLASDCQRHRWSTCLRLSTTSVVNLPPIVNDIGCQLAAGIVYIGANFPIFSSSLCILIISDFPRKSQKQYTH
jgi:hypothetical protein